MENLEEITQLNQTRAEELKDLDTTIPLKFILVLSFIVTIVLITNILLK